MKTILHYIKIGDNKIPVGRTEINETIVGMFRERWHTNIQHANYFIEQIGKCVTPGDMYVYLYKIFDNVTYSTMYVICNDKAYHYRDENKKTQYHEKIVYDELLHHVIETDFEALAHFAEYIRINHF